jgi:cytochrome c oxidase assembly factor CtaG
LAPGPTAGRFFVRNDKAGGSAYIRRMWKILLLIALFGLLVLAFWFAGETWQRFAGDSIPAYGYVAIAGGILFSLLVGGGLMALVFYSSRHGYDEGQGDKGP